MQPAVRRRRRSLGQFDRLNELDQRIAAALQVDARASWRDVARLVGSSESTVARRARALVEAGAMRSTAAMDPIKCGLGNPVLLQLRCASGMGLTVARRLAERPDIRFVTTVTGPYDVVAELIVPSKTDLADFLFEDILSIEGVVHTSTEIVLRNLKSAYDWSRGLLPDRELPTPTLSPEASDSRPLELDELDLRICEHLRHNGRSGFPELAAALNVTESMARRRLETLIGSGALHPLTLVNPRLLGYEVELFFWLQVELSKLDEVAQALLRRREVRYLSATVGYSDLVGEVILRSLADLHAFRLETLGALPAIRNLDMALELRTLKRAFLHLEERPRRPAG